MPTTRPVTVSTTRTGPPPVPRRSARSDARSGRVQYQPPGRDPEELTLHEVVDDVLRARAERHEVLRGERQLGRRGAEVGREDVRVGRVEHGRLDRPAEDRGRVVHEVGVERVVARHEHGKSPLPGPARAAGLLPHRGQRPRPPGEQHRVEPGHVDAQLEGRGRRHPEQPT